MKRMFEQSDPNNAIKLLVIENKIFYKAGFKIGFLKGIVTIFLAFALVLFVSFLFRKPLQQKFLNTVVLSASEQIFTSFPDGYFIHKREHVMQVLDDFTNAAADHRLSKEDYSYVAKMVVINLQDRYLPYQELTDLVNEISRLANKKIESLENGTKLA